MTTDIIVNIVTSAILIVTLIYLGKKFLQLTVKLFKELARERARDAELRARKNS